MPKPVLGRGLGALLGPVATSGHANPRNTVPAESPALGEVVRKVSLAEVRPCPLQPRKEFSQESLQELSDSIREQGILQPLIVRSQDGHFELIAGERRWRAAQLAGLDEVPVLVRAASDHEVLELALIENLQRENLNPLEEALGYSRLISQFQLRQEDVAAKVGKSRALVANALRLLKLPAEAQTYVKDGRLSVGHAKVILGLPTPEEQTLAAEIVLKEGLNVRKTEELVNNWAQPPALGGGQTPRGGGRAPASRDTHVIDLESRLQERLGTKVRLRYRHGKGMIQIRFFSDDELGRILQIAGVQAD